MKALLMLEDGSAFEGRSFTGPAEAFGELVFNTGLTGYQEVITDPSYAGQIVLMTNPMIGTYGIRRREGESPRVYAEGFVVREYGGEDAAGETAGRVVEQRPRCPAPAHPTYDPSDPRSGELAVDPRELHNPVVSSLADTLAAQGVPGIEGVDTRALTRRIRDRGAMRCGITTATLEREVFLAKVKASPAMAGRNLVKEVSPREPYLYHAGPAGGGPRIAVLDCGVKARTLHELARRGCRVEVFPAYASAADILKTRPDGVLLSNGPGDPAALPEIVAAVSALLGRVPVFGICLGHQILGQALGAKTFKLPFGHHGGNHPVREEGAADGAGAMRPGPAKAVGPMRIAGAADGAGAMRPGPAKAVGAGGRVFITTQNHGFAVDPAGLPPDARASFTNLNDLTNEGLRHRKLPAFSVQFHPEAAPGPHDTLFLFDRFLELVRGKKG